MRWFLLSLLALVTPTVACAASAEEQFTRDMLARIQAEAPEREMRISESEPLVIQVAASGELEEAEINLHRIFGFCGTASADDCEAVKAEFVDKIGLAPQPKPSRDQLRVVVRDQQYIDYIVEKIVPEKRPKFRAIGESLYAIIAFDSPDAIQLALPDQLGEAGLEEAEAWTLAFSQTKAVLPEIPVAEIVAGKPVAFEEYDYLASLLADTEQWERITRDAPADMFVTAVSDNFVFVAFMPSGAKLAEFAKTVEEDCRAQQRCISPHIYRFRNGRWEIAR